MVRVSGHDPDPHVTTCTNEDPPVTSLRPWPGTHVVQTALKSPWGSPVPPWIGIRTPLHVMACWSPTGVSSGSPASRKSWIASPSAVRTCGLVVSRPYGVVTGWVTSNGWENGGLGLGRVVPEPPEQERAPGIEVL